MVSETLTVTNPAGFHMRLASSFVSAMSDFQCSVAIRYNRREIDGKSIMSVMAACMKHGAVIEVRCSGPDETPALQKASSIIRCSDAI